LQAPVARGGIGRRNRYDVVHGRQQESVSRNNGPLRSALEEAAPVATDHGNAIARYPLGSVEGLGAESGSEQGRDDRIQLHPASANRTDRLAAHGGIHLPVTSYILAEVHIGALYVRFAKRPAEVEVRELVGDPDRG
ncbi:MAG: hypothetical protein ACK56I_12680, partial [bacterium]